MKNRWITIFWSVLMIAAGVLFFLHQLGVIDLENLTTTVWTIIFGALGIFFFITYFVRGTQNWGLLFPAFILSALVFIIAFEGTTLGEALSGGIIMIAIALPFIAAFLFNTKKNWWALIPAWVMGALSVIVLFENQLGDDFVGSFVLASIALPFLAVYLVDRTKRWALIPFAAMAVLAPIPLIENIMDGDTLGMLIMFLFAIPFFVVYFWSKKSWWAIIPAGVFTSIGLVVLIMEVLIQPAFQLNGFNRLGTAILLAGIGITFGFIWLRRKEFNTDWAKYPAAALFVIAALSLIVGQNSPLLWPLFLIGGGAAIILISIFKKPAETIETPEE